MAEQFCKLFETDDGQILLKIADSSEDEMEAEIRLYFEPEGFGVCEAAVNFKHLEKAQETFRAFTEERAIEWAGRVRSEILAMGLTP